MQLQMSIDPKRQDSRRLSLDITLTLQLKKENVNQ